MQKEKAKKIIPLLILAVAGLGAWLYFGAGASDELILYGNVDQRQIELAFIDSERIAEILVQEGMEVQEGQLLALLETRRLKDKIAVAEAQLESAKAALSKLKNGTRPEEIDQSRAAVTSAEAEMAFAEAQYKRFDGLFKNSTGKAVSKQDLDAALLQRNIARAKLLERQKALRLAEIGPRDEDIAEASARLAERERALEELHNRLGDAELKSPAHSIINRRLLEPGDLASPQRAVFSLAVLSPKWVRAYVSETELGRIAPGMQALIHTDSHPDKGISGTVGFISSVAEFTPKAVETRELRTSLVYEVRIHVEDPQNILRLGMPATVSFPAAK